MTSSPEFQTLEDAAAWLESQEPGVWSLAVMHDDACLHGPNHACTCRPTYAMKAATEASVRDGVAKYRQWMTRHRRN